MTTTEFETVKRKIEMVKQENQRKQGAIDQIKSQWKEHYGFETVEEAKAKLDELKALEEEQKSRIATLEEKLKAALPEGF